MPVDNVPSNFKESMHRSTVSIQQSVNAASGAGLIRPDTLTDAKAATR
jgi:hypothetical protein